MASQNILSTLSNATTEIPGFNSSDHTLQSDEELKLSVKERALKAFSKIEGLDDIKEMMLRALESLERAHTLLIGPPASAKSLFMLEIEKSMPPNKVYFIEGGSTTKAGIQKFIAENPQKRNYHNR